MNETLRGLLRTLPAVEAILQRPKIMASFSDYSRRHVTDAVRHVVAVYRQEIVGGTRCSVQIDEMEDDILRYVRQHDRPCLRPVINATGTVLHTNLGRAILSQAAIDEAVAGATHYTNLEYDLHHGCRGSRYDHCRSLLCKLTGAEDALVVNNNAAAVLLAVTTLAQGKDVILSRGELVEVGGSFRIPDVITACGARLREVGTTNKTHLSDYERAMTDETAVIMKVHCSNYKIIGFTETPQLKVISHFCHSHGLPLLYDLGSGLFLDMTAYGLPEEPVVSQAIRNGADIVTFSGDKLLGGPQAGIIAGKKEYIQTMKHHPLLRALRVDKMTLAALEGTLRLYEQNRAEQDIPVVHMLAQTEEDCRKKSEALQRAIEWEHLAVTTRLMGCDDVVGGGSYPTETLPGWAVALAPLNSSVTELEEALRLGDMPVIARVHRNWVLLSMRTVLEDEIPLLCQAIGDAIRG
ncbi:MAG: L-seryl-tRNA(Sec) selenium transferase [Megasphaera sp.]|jgi:L-seryl-tRNA(Ser) seleniumtransferase|nr:L-seryl-tRNA(Sec) selenium transferase [Megasphaera sp.]